MPAPRAQDADIRRAHLRWFSELSAERQLDHLHSYDGLPPRASVDLTTHQGRIAAHNQRHRPTRRRGTGR